MLLSNLELRMNARPKCFFQYDYMLPVLRKACHILHAPSPRYRTEEVDLELLLKPPHPPNTGYRLLVSLCAIGVGSLKGAMSLQGKPTQPTVVEWVSGVLLAIW